MVVPRTARVPATVKLAASAGLPIFWHFACIRMDDHAAGPTLYHNTAHYAVGIDRVEVNGTVLKVVFAGQPDPYHPIMSGWVDVDETGVQHGITAGFSGGGDYANILFAIGGSRVSVTDERLYHPQFNLWCGWAKTSRVV